MRIQDSETYISDLDLSVSHALGIEKLRAMSVLITGATGTIGSYIADMLLSFNKKQNARIKIYLAGRSIEKLMSMYSYWNDNNLQFVQYDVTNKISFDFHVDYIIHAAGNAHPTAFNEDPVGTIMGNIAGTYNLLEFGRTHGTKRLLYVSSGEVYGQGDLSIEEFEEGYSGYVDPLSPRSCYPSSKRTAENLCASYAKQFDLETVVVRPCHTYGPGITPTDSRVNAQFIRNVLNIEDIVMKSAGTQLRSYNYIGDCASAIITVLLKGENGQAYNIANPYVRITIAQLAELIAAVGGRRVIFTDPSALDIANRTPIAKQVLSTKKLESLGWKGVFSATTGIKHTIEILQGK